MKRVVAIALAAAALALLAWAGSRFGWLSGVLGIGPTDGGAATSTDGRATSAAAPQGVAALGRLEPAGGLIDIAAVPGDRVEKIQVKEGQRVTKGQKLVLMESHALRALELSAAQSQLEEAEARLQSETRLAAVRITTADLALKKARTVDLDIKTQEKKLQVARANLELARKDQARLAALREGLVSPQESERQDMVVQQAEAQVQADEAMLEKLTRTKDLSLEAAQADLDAANATRDQVLSAIPVKSLRSQRDLAQKQLERAELAAPCDGTVLKVFMREGETVGQRPVLQMGDLGSMVVVAEVYESDAKRVKPGQSVEIHSRAFPKPYDEKGLRGKVESVAKMITSPVLRSLDPLAPSDRRVVEVRVRVAEQDVPHAADLSNLQVDVTIVPGP